MTKELSNPKFDYEQLSKDEKSKIIYFEGELSRSRKRVVDELIKHGEILHGVQQLLANHTSGVFCSWLESVGVSKTSAYKAISAFVEFGSCPHVDNLEVSAIYELSHHKSAKHKALTLAAKGVKVTHSMALGLIAKAEETSPPGPPVGDQETDEEAPEDDRTVSNKKPSKPAKQYDRSFWYKQWNQSIGPLVRLVDKIAHGVGEAKCESQQCVQDHLAAATEEMMEWLGVKK